MADDAAASRRLRLLFLLPHVPGFQATTGGARSTAHLIAALSLRHDVAVLALRFANDLPLADEELRRTCQLLETIDPPPIAASWWRRARSRILPLVSVPKWVLAADVPAYRQRVHSLVREWRPDIVHFFYHVMAQYVTELSGCNVPRALTQYEPGTAAALDVARRARGLMRLRARLEARAWARYERRILRHFHAVVVLTERDRRTLAPWTASIPVVRAPLGVPISACPLNPIGSDSSSVLFVGNFLHPPNVDAALWLMRSIFPRVRALRPDTRLLVVGPDPTPEMSAMASAQISVTGAVDSVTPFLDRASVVAAPLRAGGGMRVKVIEALAAGKAVVATALAAEGLDVTHGDQLLIADREAEFASSLMRLLENSAERARLAQRAREWARTNLTWSRSVAAYEEVHEALVPSLPCDRTGRVAASLGIRS